MRLFKHPLRRRKVWNPLTTTTAPRPYSPVSVSRFALLSNSNYEPKSSLNPGLRGGVYQKSLWFCLTSLF
jgi:hypothetical protein